MKINKLLLLLTILFLMGIKITLACDCRSRGTIAEEFENTTAVFSGKVIAEEYQEITDTSDKDFGLEVLIVKIKVDRWWKRKGDGEVVLRTETARKGWVRRSSCDFPFKMEQSYLVFAGDHKGWLVTDNCSRTKELSRADEDLKELGAGFSANQTKLECPTITVFLQTNNPFKDNTWVYSARVENAEPNQKLTYQWKYLIGSEEKPIKAGQGTSTITIDNIDLNLGITVWVVVGGLPKGCKNRVGESVIS